VAVKILLRQSVENLGEPGAIVSVAPGYARNYLFPKGYAIEATPGNLKMLESKRKVWAARRARVVEAAQALAARIAAVELKITKKSGEGGTLYGSVTKAEIHDLLTAKGFEVDRRRIGPDNPIKALGSFEITVKLHPEVTAQTKLLVEAEEVAE